MFEWLRRRGGSQLITCTSCGRSMVPQFFNDYGEFDVRTYCCLPCKQAGLGPDPVCFDDRLWKECGRESETELIKVKLKVRAQRL